MGVEELNRAELIIESLMKQKQNLHWLEDEYRGQTKGEMYTKRYNQYRKACKDYLDQFLEMITLQHIYKVIIPTRGNRENKVLYVSKLKESEIRYLLNRLGIPDYKVIKIETSETLDLQMIL